MSGSVCVGNKVEAGFHRCPCCGRDGVKDIYDYCYSCQMKWRTVYNRCLSGGVPDDVAEAKADKAYPRKFRYDV